MEKMNKLLQLEARAQDLREDLEALHLEFVAHGLHGTATGRAVAAACDAWAEGLDAQEEVADE